MYNEQSDAGPAQQTRRRALSTPRASTRIVIDSNQKWYSINWSELWEARELLYFLNWRDVKVRYKQTVLGSLWAVLNPVLTMTIYTVVFGRMVGLDKDVEGVPYAIFVFSGLLPWNLFSGIFGKTSNCVVSGTALVTKVYFPRLALPISSVGVNLLDFSIAFGVLLGMMVIFKVPIFLSVLYVPAAVFLVVLAALGLSTFIAALTAFYRDFQFISTYLLQLWLYLTPVIYPFSIVPEKWRWLVALNPLVGPIEAFRHVLVPAAVDFDPMVLLISMCSSLVLLSVGVLYYNSASPRFSDCV